MKTIKLCDGFRIFEGSHLVKETENYQDVREYLGLELGSQTWSDITRELFALGRCEIKYQTESGKNGIINLEVIPTKDREIKENED